MKMWIFGVFILVVFINSASAGNVAPATAIIEDTNGNGIMGCSDTLKLSFHTSSPWVIELNGAPFMNGSGPNDTTPETEQHENTRVNIFIDPQKFVCDDSDTDLFQIRSSNPINGDSMFFLKFPPLPFPIGGNYEFPPDDWMHVDPPEPPVPEASTILLVGLGIAGLVGMGIKKRKV